MNSVPPTPFPDAADTWNQRFKEDAYIFGTEPNAWLREHAQVWQPGQRVLCVADGEGRNSVWLAGQGLEVTAFDFSPVAVDKARKLAAQRGVRVAYEVAGVADWAWPRACFDVVAAIFVQFATPTVRAPMFERMAAALKPGGLLLLEGYAPKQLDYRTGGPPQLDQLYTPQLLREAFAGLEILELREYSAVLEEGSRHRGPSALIDLVARRPA